MNIFLALAKREISDGKNGYLRVPVILAALAVALVVISSMGFGNMVYFKGMEREGIESAQHGSFERLGDAVQYLENTNPEDRPAIVTMGYWAMSSLPLIAFPFVVFFSLLGSLYEERRDRSILFWKSMPVADWQEVGVKLFVPVVIAPLVFLAVLIVAQLVIALSLSLIVLVQGGPFMALWPLGFMIGSWYAAITMYLIHAFWVVPILAWVLLVSSHANRMPFLWVILLPVVVMVMEKLLLDTHVVGSWIGVHMGGWLDGALGGSIEEFRNPDHALRYLIGGPQMEALKYSLASIHFWAGLVVAGGLVFATVEKRKRAI